MPRKTTETGRVQLTPTWRGILPALMWATRDGTAEGRRIARAELARMAEAANQAPEPIDLRASLGAILADLREDAPARRRDAEIKLERLAVAADAFNASIPEAA